MLTKSCRVTGDFKGPPDRLSVQSFPLPEGEVRRRPVCQAPPVNTASQPRIPLEPGPGLLAGLLRMLQGEVARPMSTRSPDATLVAGCSKPQPWCAGRRSLWQGVQMRLLQKHRCSAPATAAMLSGREHT